MVFHIAVLNDDRLLEEQVLFKAAEEATVVLVGAEVAMARDRIARIIIHARDDAS
jgi:hypothetical protein